jgi:dihydroorotate dehydrogenase (fumarate)
MDLTTTYMGLTLKNPLVASASPISQRVEDIKKLEDHGAAAVVLFSIFEEQIHHDAEALDHLLTAGTDSFAEALSYFPEADSYAVGPDRYLELIARRGPSARFRSSAASTGCRMKAGSIMRRRSRKPAPTRSS